MNVEEHNGSTVFKRQSEYVPRRNWRNFLIGRPLSTADAPHQTIGKTLGLAVFSSDAMSSVAYAPQEMLIILAAAGVSSFGISIPLAIAICILLIILTLSYEQTIHAYPDGGGAYIVARDNLGELPAQTAAAALLTDYILTVVRFHFLRCRTTCVSLPGINSPPGYHFNWFGHVCYVDQSTRCERVRDNFCNSYLLFHRHDVHNDCLGIPQIASSRTLGSVTLAPTDIMACIQTLQPITLIPHTKGFF